MTNTNKSYIPPEVLARMELGRQKKLWAIEIRYSVPGTNESKLERRRNMTSEELMKFRETMFKYGFTIPVGSGHWKIVCPVDIIEVDLYRQDKYIAENLELPTK